MRDFSCDEEWLAVELGTCSVSYTLSRKMTIIFMNLTYEDLLKFKISVISRECGDLFCGLFKFSERVLSCGWDLEAIAIPLSGCKIRVF